jgi:hypothetical protein
MIDLTKRLSPHDTSLFFTFPLALWSSIGPFLKNIQ